MKKTHDVRWKLRFSNFKKAFSHLSNAISLSEKKTLSELENYGLIKSFEFTFELSWNVMKDFLSDSGINGIMGSRDAIRKAFSVGLISDGETWMQMVSDRNLASHYYDEETANKLCFSIKEKYTSLFLEVSETMEQKI